MEEDRLMKQIKISPRGEKEGRNMRIANGKKKET